MSWKVSDLPAPDVHIVDVRQIVADEQYTIPRNVVLLQETGAQRRILGIWVGRFEAEAILILLSGVEAPRPLTFNFANSLLDAAGAQLREVRVNRLVNLTYFAETIIQAHDGRERLVDARPSDAISLALTRNAPIRVAEGVMREAGQLPSGVETNLAVDGKRVLGRADILEEMERTRIQREAEVQRMSDEFRERQASRQSSD